MKLTGAQASAFFSKPEPGLAGILLFGADAMRVSLRRQQVIKTLAGEGAEHEMRLSRMLGADARKDPAMVLDAIKAQGFFPGPRVVFVEDATDALSPVIEAALTDWADGDATLVVTAGSLNARSKLRKIFEAGQKTRSIGIYDDPPGRDEVQRLLQAQGIADRAQPVMEDILALARDLDPGELAQVIEKLSLYVHDSTGPISSEDLQAVLPDTTEAALDDAINIVAEGRSGEVVPMLRRLTGQGVNPTFLCISMTRHFRTLHAAACHPNGPDTALSRARPPVFGPRKDRMARQARAWGSAKLEQALAQLMDTDLALRSSQRAPEAALVERAFIRLSMMKR